MSSPNSSRLAYIDWMRGLACIVMFQTHCYDSWLSPQARRSKFFVWSQLGGTLPAPLFLFLAGMSVALIAQKLRRKGLHPTTIARATIRRGAEILALGLLFRIQEYVVAWGWSPWTDLLRVDVLNIIGVSLMLMGACCWMVASWVNRSRRGEIPRVRFPRAVLFETAAGVTVLISFLTPLLWTTWQPGWMPWPLESYINGVHNLGTPQSWLFPIFPWSGFAFAGLAVGFFLFSDWARQREAMLFGLAGLSGIGLIYFTRWLDARPVQLFPVYDYWHTSPDFFFLRIGLLLVVLCAAYLWCRWGAGQWGFSPLIQLGQTSLLVYWVHLEFVYGRLSILPKHVVDIRAASIGLLTIFLAMVLLSWLRTRWKEERGKPLRRAAKAG